jgi:hypothetical protein
MLNSKDRRVVARAVAFIVLVPLLFITYAVYDMFLCQIREGYTVPIAASNLQTLAEISDHATTDSAGKPLVLPVGTKCWITETRPCVGCKSLYASRVRIRDGDKMGKLMWVCSDNVRPVYAAL